jgi:hypothetical protein
MKPIVYLMHSSSEQLDLWLQNLPTQDLDLVNVSPTKDIVTVLEQIPVSNLPSLILVEMSIQCPESNLLQASKLGRWRKDNHPSIQIVFLTTRSEFELTKLEERWAVKQGAVAIFPKLDQKSLSSQISQIYAYLNLELVIPADPTPEILSSGTPETIDNLDDSLSKAEKKDFEVAMEQLREVLKSHTESIDTYPTAREIFTHFKNLEEAIQGYITMDSKRRKLYSIGERFAQINRAAGKSNLNSVNSNNSPQSVFSDFIPE